MQQQTHPKVSGKKLATGQSCIRKRSTTCKIETLGIQFSKIILATLFCGILKLSYKKEEKIQVVNKIAS